MVSGELSDIMSSTFCLVMLFWMGFGATSHEIVVGLAKRWDILEDIIFFVQIQNKKKNGLHTPPSVGVR